MWSSSSADKLFSETSQIPWENLTAHDYLQHSQAGWLFLFYLVQSPVTQDIVTVAWNHKFHIDQLFFKISFRYDSYDQEAFFNKSRQFYMWGRTPPDMYTHIFNHLYHPCLSRVSAYIFALQMFCDFLVYCSCCWM